MSPEEQRARRLAALEWRDGETVVDVGGGNRSLLLELFARRPGLLGIVLDLEPVWRSLLDAAGLRIDSIGEQLVQASCP